MNKREYDFFDSDGLYKIYQKTKRNHIIAICQSAFDAMIVVNALSHPVVVSEPCDCSDEIDELKEAHEAQIEEIQEDHATELAAVKAECDGRIAEAEAIDKVEQIFDPS